MIEVRDLHKSFAAPGARGGRVTAVQGLHLAAPDGRITGLLGQNGAGKTTTLRIVAGLLEADAGEVRVDGLDVRTRRRDVLSRLGVLGDARGLYPRLTALENIVYFGRLQGLDARRATARARSLAAVLGFETLLDRRTEGFSQGERVKTALARALVHDPPNVVLDEPTNGLDVQAVRSLREALRRLRDETGKCVVLSTHVMQEVERLCDTVVVVSGGRDVAHGSVAALCERAGERSLEEAFVRLAFGAGGTA